MAPLKIPPELKRITQYIRRAEELDNDKTKPESRLVAYYCRQYAVQSGISLAKSDASRNCLGDILAELEKEKEPMSAFSKEEAYVVSRKFAVDVFDKADAEDRGGVANKGTAKTFYAAAVFLEVLEQFDDVSEEDIKENKQKRIYAKWKATEILKAIKEGREILPGGYSEEAGDDANVSVNVKEESTGSNNAVEEEEEEEEEDLPPVPIAPSGTIAANNTIPKVDMHVPPKMNVDHPPAAKQNITNNEGNSGVEVDLYGPPPPAYNVSTHAPAGNNASLPVVPMAPPAGMPPPVDVPAPAPSSSGRTMSSMLGFGNARTNGSHGKKLSKEQWDDAKELARFALVAIDARDVDLAAARLQQALQALGR